MTHPDAELIALGKDLEAAWAHERIAAARWRLVGDSNREAESTFLAAYQASKAIVSRIEAKRAHTLAGLRVKTAAIGWTRDDEEVEPSYQSVPQTTDIRLTSLRCSTPAEHSDVPDLA